MTADAAGPRVTAERLCFVPSGPKPGKAGSDDSRRLAKTGGEKGIWVSAQLVDSHRPESFSDDPLLLLPTEQNKRSGKRARQKVKKPDTRANGNGAAR